MQIYSKVRTLWLKMRLSMIVNITHPSFLSHHTIQKLRHNAEQNYFFRNRTSMDLSLILLILYLILKLAWSNKLVNLLLSYINICKSTLAPRTIYIYIRNFALNLKPIFDYKWMYSISGINIQPIINFSVKINKTVMEQ